MGVSGFQIKATNSGQSSAADTEMLATDIDWGPGTPENFLRETHVQFKLDLATMVEVTFNGGTDWYLINNGDTINGAATFTIFVTKGDMMNFRIKTGLVVNFEIIVTGD